MKKKTIIVCDTPSYNPSRVIGNIRLYEGFEDEVAIEKQLLAKGTNSVIKGKKISQMFQSISI